MNSFKEGSKEAFLYSIMNEEHKKPNIIRGNSSKLPKVTPAVVQRNNHLKQVTPSVSAALKSLEIENISCGTNNNLVMENLMISDTGEVVDVVPETTRSCSDSDPPTQADDIDPADRSNNMQQQIIDVSDPNVSFYLNEYGELQVVSSSGENMNVKLSDSETSEPMVNDNEFVQASLQTDEGEFLILVKGGEIVAVQPPVQKQEREEGEIEKSSAEHNWITSCESESDKHELDSLEISQDVSQRLYQASDGSRDSIPGSTTMKIEIDDSVSESNSEDRNQYYVTVQLADGQSILLPMSALENAAAGGDQIVLDDIGQYVEMFNTSQEGPRASDGALSQPQIKPAKANKQKKKTTISRINPTSARPSNTKSIVSSVTTSSGFLAPSHQMNAIADAIVNQRNVDSKSNLQVLPMPPAVVYPSYSRTNFSRVDAIPQKELKPKPFRFEMSESDDENMEFQSSTFLPLVIENYQSSFRKQRNENQGASECNSDFKASKTESSLMKLSPELFPDVTCGIHSAKSSEEFPNKTSMSSVVQCSKCSFKATSRCSLSQHMASSHSEELPYKCLKCHRKFIYHYLLLNHMKLHEKYESTQPPYSCDTCKHEFHTKADINTHACEQHKLENGSASLSTVSKKDGNPGGVRPKQYPCMENLCYDWFDDEIKATRHHLEKHSDITHGPFKCQFCSSDFNSKFEFLKHLSSHEDKKEKNPRCNLNGSYLLEKTVNGHRNSYNHNDYQTKELENDTAISKGESGVDQLKCAQPSDNETQKEEIKTSSFQEPKIPPVESVKVHETSNLSSPTEVSNEFRSLFAKIREEALEKDKRKTKEKDGKPSSAYVTKIQPVTDQNEVDSPPKSSPIKTSIENTSNENGHDNQHESKKPAREDFNNSKVESNSTLTVNTRDVVKKTRQSRKVNPSLNSNRTGEDKIVIVSDDEIELIYKPVKQQMLEITESGTPVTQSEPVESNSKPITRSQISKQVNSNNVPLGKRSSEPEHVESAFVKRRC